MSSKGEVNSATGEFTIHNVELTDADYYYYSFHTDGGTDDIGHKYEINLTVSGKCFVNSTTIISLTFINKLPQNEPVAKQKKICFS